MPPPRHPPNIPPLIRNSSFLRTSLVRTPLRSVVTAIEFSLAGQLFQPDLSAALRLQIASQMCSLLDSGLSIPSEWIPPPAAPALLDPSLD